jgi:hypothetical protein
MPPIAIMFMNSSEEERDAAIRRTIHVIRRTDAVLPYAKAYVEMLIDVLKGLRVMLWLPVAGAYCLIFDIVM